MRHLLLLILCLTAPLWGATVTSSVTGTGALTPISLPANQYSTSSSYTLSGTWAGTMVWQYSTSGSGNWNTLATYTGNIGPVVFANPGFYRWNCTVYTSGTVTAAVTTPYFIYAQITNNQGATVFQVDDSGTTVVGASPQIVPAGNQEAAFYQGNVNNYLELQVQNKNAGSSASSDFVATANDGTATTHYVDLGINGSTGGAAPFTAAHGAYVYSIDNLLDLGAVGATGTVNIDVGATPTAVLNVDYANGVSVNDVTDPTKQIRFNPANQTTGTILTLNSGAQTVSRTLSVPVLSGADTLATIGLSQTWTGTPVFGAGLTAKTPISLEDVTDPTKQILWSISPATTATNLTIADNQSTTQTLNIPNITATDTVDTLGLAQTISGAKTFSAVTNVSNTTSATTSLLGAVVIGNGTAVTSVATGGGIVIAGTGIGVGVAPSSGTYINTSLSANGGQTWQNTNSNGGTGAFTNLVLNNGTAKCNLFMLGTAFTTAGALAQNTGVLYSNGAGLNIDAAGTGGTINFFVNGNATSSGGIASTGVWTLGAPTVPSANTFTGNIIWGRNTAAADTAGAVGETISGAFSGVAAAATTVTGNVGSVSLTAGKWLVSGKVVIHAGATGLTVGTTYQASCPVGTAATGTSGTTMAQQSAPAVSIIANGLFSLSIDAQVVNISATTSEFLTCNLTYAGGSPTIDGSITAVRLP